MDKMGSDTIESIKMGAVPVFLRIIIVMNSEEKRLIKILSAKAKDAVDFFSSRRKPEREKSVCVAFLRCLGIAFDISEISTPDDEPPDVLYNTARFEVIEILSNKKRHLTFKERAQRLSKAVGLDELFQPYRPPKPIDLRDVVRLITDSLLKKATKYSPQTRSTLDILVYVNLNEIYFLNQDSDIPSLDELSKQGWQSVSFLFNPYSHVLLAQESAPSFLRNALNQTRRQWKNSTTVFEI